MKEFKVHPSVLNEACWHSFTNARTVFTLLQSIWTPRKVLACLCAVSRHAIDNGRDRQGILIKGVEFAENQLDLQSPERQWPAELAKELNSVQQAGRVRSKSVDMVRHLLAVGWSSDSIDLSRAVFCFEASRRSQQDDPFQSNFLRDIFGNPFRPVTFDPRWRTSDVVDVARGIYEDKAFERMPILADALMDAGCENEEIIGHCRGDGPHVRGCWVVDLVLGKE